MYSRIVVLMSTLALASTPVFATGFERPIPQAQTAATELWFGLASLMLCVALYVVHRVIKRK